ncbi:xanthine dehydrogenase family protein subunit M [Rhodopseudomonas boonkerdii]|uniref:FAD binding domain-containing protein n=1 Tax=Rhodopseudomonas boonkerdii TaxID=475937 RepID=UPI001E36A75D|nr:xanthine dehydrogenase family protein subunit M [Rhodopseudomonas boonkerdii]UGV25299.1 xanthine dehydrogenase family protein subunit M [Rhodopseudomonas boonkerdii]
MKLPSLDYARPATLNEAIAILAAQGGDAKAIAGGQSLMPMLAFRLAAPKLLVDIGRLPGLNRIDVSEDGVDLGALVTWRMIERDARLAQAHPLLAAAIAHVAHYQVRNRGTVGGSLAHADPAAEMPGIAVTCDALLTVVGLNGMRIVPAAAFFRGGLETVLAPDELIVNVRLPPWRRARRWGFAEFGRRRGDFAMAGVAVYYDLDVQGDIGDAHVGVIGVADRPVRLKDVEGILNGQRPSVDLIRQAADVARGAVDPSDDIHAEGAYRRELVGVLLERVLATAGNIKIPEAAWHL